MANTTDIFRYLVLACRQNVGRQALARIPEPEVMDRDRSVEQFDRSMETQLSIAYAIALEWISRAIDESVLHGTAVDLACGSGQFTCCLAEQMPFQHVFGIDLSDGMLARARAKAAAAKLQIEFQRCDARRLEGFKDNSVSLCTFNQSAHHLPSIDDVSEVVAEMDRITEPDGIVFISDLVRLRTATITEEYVEIVGREYNRLGLDEFYCDFRNSMFAAWTPIEMRQIAKSCRKRKWFQLVPLGFPVIQLVLGIPTGQTDLRRRAEYASCPVPPNYRVEFQLMRTALEATMPFQIST